jgi:hypothetical protein
VERYEDQSHLSIHQWQPKRSNLQPLAGLSRPWKAAIELITFRNVGITSNELDTFQEFVTGRRCHHLGTSAFQVKLPEYTVVSHLQAKPPPAEKQQNETFTREVRALFAIWNAWVRNCVQTPLRIELRNIFSRNDTRYLSSIWDKEFTFSYLRFDDSDSLPILSNVQALVIDGPRKRELASHTAPDLARSLPNLREIEWIFEGYNWKGYVVDDDALPYRQDDRIAFAKALEYCSLVPHSTATIEFYHEFPMDQRLACPSLISAGLSYDPFSAALRTFSKDLVSLTLRALIDSTLFWPSSDEFDTPTPMWPYLKTLNVTFPMVSSHGDWYFTSKRPPNHPEDDTELGEIGDCNCDPTCDPDSNWANYRNEADAVIFDPFLAAFTRAVQNMPILEHFMLAEEFMDLKSQFHIAYHAPGRLAEWGDESEEDVKARRVYYACRLDKAWRPEQDTALALSRTGEAKFGGDVIERYLKPVSRCL